MDTMNNYWLLIIRTIIMNSIQTGMAVGPFIQSESKESTD